MDDSVFSAGSVLLSVKYTQLSSEQNSLKTRHSCRGWWLGRTLRRQNTLLPNFAELMFSEFQTKETEGIKSLKISTSNIQHNECPTESDQQSLYPSMFVTDRLSTLDNTLHMEQSKK